MPLAPSGSVEAISTRRTASASTWRDTGRTLSYRSPCRGWRLTRPPPGARSSRPLGLRPPAALRDDLVHSAHQPVQRPVVQVRQRTKDLRPLDNPPTEPLREPLRQRKE